MPSAVPLSGSLGENSLPKLLTHLNEIKSTGTLTLAKDGLTKKLYLKHGDIIFASSTYEGDRLGEILLKEGKLSLTQFESASKVTIQTGKRLGGVLVELGYIKPKDLFWGVKHQVEEIVYSLFAWLDCDYEFVQGDILAAEVITLHMSTANLILQGIKRIDDWTRISRGMPSMDTILRLSKNPLKLYQSLNLNDDEKRLISLFDGVRSLKEIFVEAKMGDFEALKAVYVLFSIGMIEVSDGGDQAEQKPVTIISEVDGLDKDAIHKAYMDAKSQNYYEILNVDTEATSQEIEDSYHLLAKLYHPDQQYRSGMKELGGEFDELFSRVTQAYTILADDSRRWEYDLSLATACDRSGSMKAIMPKNADKAKDCFAKGIESFKSKDFESATVHFKEATRLDACNASYFSYLALALLQRPKREGEAEEAMLAAVELDPMNADNLANLGLLYQKAGMKDKAKAAFTEALKLNPNNAKAMKGLGMKGKV